jgi:hypothetical protein
MADYSIFDLNKVLEKANAPTGDAQAMRNFLPNLEPAVRQAVGNQENPAIAAGKQKYMDQIHQLAAMDQKLAGSYGDPASKMYIENPGTREKLITGAASTGYKAAANIKSNVQSLRKADEAQNRRDVSDVVSYYKQLTAVQDREEKKKDKASKSNVADIKKLKAQTAKSLGVTVSEMDQIDQAQIKQQDAIDEFLQAPTAFKKLWVRHLAQVDSGDIPPEGYTAEDLQQAITAYNKTQQKKKEALKSKTTSTTLFSPSPTASPSESTSNEDLFP